jgi:hypothetical protein
MATIAMPSLGNIGEGKYYSVNRLQPVEIEHKLLSTSFHRLYLPLYKKLTEELFF